MSLWETRSGRILAGAVVALLVATLAGLAILWPGDDAVGGSGAPETVGAEVLSTSTPDCGGPQRQRCLRVAVMVGGESSVPVTVGPVNLAPDIEPGDDVRLLRSEAPEGVPGAERYAFSGIDRQWPLGLLLALVAVVAAALVRLRGVLALTGLALSLLLVVEFVLPAILAGESALAVALVGAMAVTFVTVVLTSGIGAQSLAALLGIAITLVLAALGGLLVADAAALDGRQTELAQALATRDAELSLKGVVLAGMVLGALGALTDTAVTQASAVMALRRAAPDMGARRLYLEASTIGRDHLSASIHTLALAYAGALLPLLLAIRVNGTGFADALAIQDLAEPAAAILVGVLALLACVPVTTGLATLLAVRVPADALPEGHAHHH